MSAMTEEPNHPSASENSLSYADNEFVARVLSLRQTDPRQINYTICVKVIINPKGQLQEVDFSYKPDEESLESVIDEMIDALELNEDPHYEIIINSIINAMKTKQMKIVKIAMPMETPQQQNDIDTFTFLPLSPLVVSPRTIHRKSLASFPDLRSNSLTESDAMSLIKEVKCESNNHSDDTYEDDDDELYDYLCSKDSTKYNHLTL
eukprot:UN12415